MQSAIVPLSQVAPRRIANSMADVGENPTLWPKFLHAGIPALRVENISGGWK